MKGVKKKKGGGELAFFGKCSLLLGGEQVCGFALIRGNKAVFSFLLNPSEVWCNWFNPLLFQVSLLPAETAKEQRADGRAELGAPEMQQVRSRVLGVGVPCCQRGGEETQLIKSCQIFQELCKCIDVFGTRPHRWIFLG